MMIRLIPWPRYKKAEGPMMVLLDPRNGPHVIWETYLIVMFGFCLYPCDVLRQRHEAIAGSEEQCLNAYNEI